MKRTPTKSTWLGLRCPANPDHGITVVIETAAGQRFHCPHFDHEPVIVQLRPMVRHREGRMKHRILTATCRFAGVHRDGRTFCGKPAYATTAVPLCWRHRRWLQKHQAEARLAQVRL